ncbi:MAG: transglutaminase-like cysteine peptidase [Oceanospirillaceae bacterium]|nr:transglutaminase-like cysteine peptidase [Oceanospirillaceae bacterium]
MKRVLLFLALFTGVLGFAFQSAQAAPVRWSDEVFTHVQSEYGIAASNRLRRIYDTLMANADKPLRQKLEVVNDTMNKLPWVTDRDKWNAEDYWATPMETIVKYGGDCEDMAIGKFVGLRLMGVPKENLYLGYVKVKATGEAHMVLVWVNDAQTETLVLDNLVPEIKSGKERTDLVAVYLFDADGDLVLIDDNGEDRSIKAEISGRKMQKLETIKARIEENREKYRVYNEGRPLF